MPSPIDYLREAIHHCRQLRKGRQAVYLDYPVHPAPRYGYGRPPHTLLYRRIDRHRTAYAATLETLSAHGSGLAGIPSEAPAQAAEPYWRNGFLEALDPASLYCFLAALRPRRYIEVGSGNSTKFARRAIEQHGLGTRVVSIDPQPRAEIDALCDEVLRIPLEAVDVTLFETLERDDILVIDNSHRCFQNSDVTVVFLEVLPRLKPGVLVYFDDIYLPYDYPPEWAGRYYSEQYLLAVLLLADRERYEVVLPSAFMARDEDLTRQVQQFWKRIGREDIGGCGNGFWLRVLPG